MTNDNNHIPFTKAAEIAGDILEEQDEATVFQVFECSHCGVTTQTMEPNAFHEDGRCSECGKDTDLKETGCGFVVIIGPVDDVIEAAATAACGKPEGQA
jgi:hypothetical protein